MSDRSKKELREDLEALQAEVDTLRREARRERQVRRTCETLLDRTVDGIFTARVRDDGQIDALWTNDSMPVRNGVLESVVFSDAVPAHCRHVVRTGQPSRFRVEMQNGSPKSSDQSSSNACTSDLSATVGATPHASSSSDSAEVWEVTLAPVTEQEASVFEGPDHPAEKKGRTGSTASDGSLPWGASSRTADDGNGAGQWEASGDGAGDPGIHYVRGLVRASTQLADQRALRETHALQNQLVELLPDAILIVGSDDRVLFTNSAALRMLGVSTEEEVLGEKMWEFVHPASHKRTREWKDQVRRGAPVGFSETKLVQSDGTSFPVETASVPITYRGQRAALTAVRNLAGRQRMADTIQRTLDLFDQAFHLGPSALLILRVRDGMILEVSDRMIEFAGYSARDLLGQTFVQIGVELASASLEHLAHELVVNGAIHDRELEVHLPDGSLRVVLMSARLTKIDGHLCALISIVNITERKKAALEVRESRTLLDKIFRVSPAPIAICRLDDWQYLDVNDAMCDLVGYPHDELVGHTPGDVDLWVDADSERNLSETLDVRDAVHDYEARFRRADGETVTTLSSFQRITVDGKECVLAVMTDITQREEAKQALIEAKDRAEEIAQFRSTVLSNMTHEVRTPLTVILGFTSILREGVRDDYHRFVDLIERSGRRLLLTLDSLLDLAQLEAGTLEPDMEIQSVAEAVKTMAASHEGVAEKKGLAFSVEVPETHVFAEFDHELLDRVLNHLVDNAMKFTTEGGITVQVEEGDETVSIAVRDTGPGIGEAFQTRIFDAFSQESEGNTRSHQGSGLGLTVSKRIIECMGGRLVVDSTKGDGTCVSIGLPRVRIEE